MSHVSKPTPIRALKPWRTRGGTWRGGNVLARSATTVTVRIECEHGAWEQFTIAAALAPQAAAGDSIAVRIGNIGAATRDYLIVETRGARPCGGVEGAPGHIEYEWTGESRHWW